MAHLFGTLVTIFVVFAAPFALAKAAEEPASPSCNQVLVDQAQRIKTRRNEIIAAALHYNSRAPQLNIAIILGATVEFLKDPIPVESLKMPISEEELKGLVEKFNRIHEAYGIPVATVGFVTSRPVRRWIEPSEVGLLYENILRSVYAAIVRDVGSLLPREPIYRDFRTIRREEVLNASKETGFMVDTFFTGAKFERAANQYKLVGKKVEDFLKSEKFKHAAAEYKNNMAKIVKAQIAKDPTEPADIMMLSYSTNEGIKLEIKSDLDSMTDLPASFLPEFIYHASGY